MSSDKAYRALHLKYCALEEELNAVRAQLNRYTVDRCYTSSKLVAAQAEIADLTEELADKRRFCYAVELALDGLKGDYIEIIKELRKECGK